jgi:hypothetical protein
MKAMNRCARGTLNGCGSSVRGEHGVTKIAESEVIERAAMV